MKLLFGAIPYFFSLAKAVQPKLIEKSEIIINSHHPLQSLKMKKKLYLDVN
jgi:hypothetical protein